MTRPKTAMIIGCGIGGPVVAMALARVGVSATVYEAHVGDADPLGSFLNLASNGLRALGAIGCDALAKSAGFETPSMIMWSGTGKKLGEVDNGMRLADGTVSVTLCRGQLHRVLRDEALRREIPLVRGKRLVSVETSSSGTTAHFADGSSARADFLVGADGLHSRTRSLVDPLAPSPRYSGQLSIGGIVRDADVARTPGEYHMVFGHDAFFGYSAPASGDAYWFANVARASEPAPGELAQTSPGEWKASLDALFARDEGPARSLIAQTGDELGAYPIHDLPTVPSWHRDGLVLLGDAAHATSPSSGQGASMAIEDAIALAAALRDGSSLSEAFTTYERARRARVERVVAYSARIGNAKIPGPVGRFFRDLAMPMALRLFANPSAHAWLFEHDTSLS